MHTDLSIDLETLGTDPGSVITQIGLCAFNARSNDSMVSTYGIHVDPQSCLDKGMTVSWSTISWWLVQSQEARDVMVRKYTVQMDMALTQVDNFVRMNLHDGFRVWGNGACFDVVLLEDMYRRAGRSVPWRFRDIRDIRTIGDMAPCSRLTKPKPEVEHSAVDDAIAQAKWVQMCMKALGETP